MNNTELKQLVQANVTLQVGDRVRLITIGERANASGFHVGDECVIKDIYENAGGIRCEIENDLTVGYVFEHELERV